VNNSIINTEKEIQKKAGEINNDPCEMTMAYISKKFIERIINKMDKILTSKQEVGEKIEAFARLTEKLRKQAIIDEIALKRQPLWKEFDNFIKNLEND